LHEGFCPVLKVSAVQYGAVFRLFQLALASLVLAAAPAAAKERLVLAFGDSLTAGYQLPPSDSFPAQLQAALRKSGKAVRVHNAGVSGDTTSSGRARLQWVLKGLKAKPDLAIVALGANDMLRGQKVADTRRNLDAIVGELRRQGVPVIIAGMLSAPNMGQAYAREYNAVFPAVAKAHDARLYPFFTAGVTANRAYLLADGMHPNKGGVGVMVKGLLPLVTAELDRLPV